MSAIETPLTRAVARANAAKRRGLGHRVPTPSGGVVAFLWRFRRVHHVDPDMDVSTAVRFHMVDMLVSLPWRIVQVRLSGITPGALDAWSPSCSPPPPGKSCFARTAPDAQRPLARQLLFHV